MTVFNKAIDLLVYTPANDATIASRLGRPEYSYYFVMKRFLPLFERLGQVRLIAGLENLAAESGESRAIGRIPILVSFTPPHLLPFDPPCVVVPVFAWEYDKIPDETCTGDPRQNWVEMLRRAPAAITHSEHTQRVVRQALGPSYPVASIPAPVWDEFNAIPQASWDGSPRSISFEGTMIDSRSATVADDGRVELREEIGRHKLDVSGLVFTSVLSPNDGRKNLSDVMTAFVWAFRNNPDVTLMLKLIHFDAVAALEPVIRLLQRLYPYRCRVVAIAAFLDDRAYQDLVHATAFVVNASVGEGQCLPLMEFLSAGRPAVAPSHTAMADYIDAQNAMIVDSSLEWTSWPQDPRGMLRCMQHHINWNSLRAAYEQAYEVATRDAERYREMSRHAIEKLKEHNSIEVVGSRLASLMTKVVSYAIEQEELTSSRGGVMERLLGLETSDGTPAAPAPDSKPRNTDAWLTGIIDARMSGWFRSETGELFEGFPITASDIVVDVGCGEGHHLSFCAKQGARLIGVDIDSQALAVARIALSNSGARAIEVYEAAAEHLPLADGLGTRIICSEVLEHVDDPLQALAELKRVGVPGALYLLTVPDAVSEELQRHVAPDAYFRKPNHVRIFERDALPKLASAAGLEVLSHTAYGFYWSVWWGLFWGCEVDLSAPDHPTLVHWDKAWTAFLGSPHGPRIKAGLDAFMPKSRVVLARKPAR
jgi:SAM-dependent methyltransferase/glycosyltransferase involved in cell wall biosynthesis